MQPIKCIEINKNISQVFHAYKKVDANKNAHFKGLYCAENENIFSYKKT